MLAQTLLRIALWMSLGVWIGSWSFFAFVVSRVAFQVLPGDVAGDLAGSLLTILHFGGAGAAIVVAAAGAALGRKGWLVALPVGLALVCLFSELWISPEIAAVRPSAIGPASTAESVRRFQLLHQLSFRLFQAVLVASLALVWRHAWLDTRSARPEA